MSPSILALLFLFYILPFYYLLFVPFSTHIRDTKKLLASAVFCVLGACLLILRRGG